MRATLNEAIAIGEMHDGMRSKQFMTRMTQWHMGFQVCAFHESNPAGKGRGFVGTWKKTEYEATVECFEAVMKLSAVIEAESKPKEATS